MWKWLSGGSSDSASHVQKESPRSAVLSLEPLEVRLTPIVGTGGFAFAADPRTVINGGDNLAGVITLDNGSCSGALIDLGMDAHGSRYVLTAGHCLRGSETQAYVTNGSGTFKFRFEAPDGTIYRTSKISVDATDDVVQDALNNAVDSSGNTGILNGNVIVDRFDTGADRVYQIFFVNDLNGVDVNELQMQNISGGVVEEIFTSVEGYDFTNTIVNFYMPRDLPRTTAFNQNDLDLQPLSFAVSGDDIIFHPDWNGIFGFEGDETELVGNLAPGVDLAILRLHAIAPFGASDYQLFSGTNEIGQKYFTIGYGAIGTSDAGPFSQIQNELQRLEINATAGSFVIGNGGNTQTVNFSANRANLELAIEALNIPNVFDVIVRDVTAGPDQGTYQIEYQSFIFFNQQQLEIVDTSNLVGTVSVNTIQNDGFNAMHIASNTYAATTFGGTQLDNTPIPLTGTDPFLGTSAPGDSGGPDFIDVGAGDLALSGIHSYSKIRGRGGFSTSVRVSKFLDFVEDVVSAGPTPVTLDLNRQTVGDDSFDESIILRRNGNFLQLFVGDVGSEQLYFQEDYATISSLDILGTTDVDTLLIDFTNGNPIPDAGMSFSGGDASPFGNPIDTINLLFDGKLVLRNDQLNLFGDGKIRLSGVENAVLTGGAGENSFDLSGWSGTATIDGQGGTDQLIGPQSASVWNITGTDTGNVDGKIQFTSIGNLNGAVNVNLIEAFSPLLFDNEFASLEVTLDVPDGTISFDRFVSSEQFFDFLNFYIDGVLVDNWSGEVPWGSVAYDVTAGTRTFT